MQSNYWFPAKRYGWGWGFPTVWQGQATLVGFILMLVAGSFVFPPQDSHWGFMAYVALISGLLLGVMRQLAPALDGGKLGLAANLLDGERAGAHVSRPDPRGDGPRRHLADHCDPAPGEDGARPRLPGPGRPALGDPEVLRHRRDDG